MRTIFFDGIPKAVLETWVIDNNKNLEYTAIQKQFTTSPNLFNNLFLFIRKILRSPQDETNATLQLVSEEYRKYVQFQPETGPSEIWADSNWNQKLSWNINNINFHKTVLIIAKNLKSGDPHFVKRALVRRLQSSDFSDWDFDTKVDVHQIDLGKVLSEANDGKRKSILPKGLLVPYILVPRFDNMSNFRATFPDVGTWRKPNR